MHTPTHHGVRRSLDDIPTRRLVRVAACSSRGVFEARRSTSSPPSHHRPGRPPRRRPRSGGRRTGGHDGTGRSPSRPPAEEYHGPQDLGRDVEHAQGPAGVGVRGPPAARATQQRWLQGSPARRPKTSLWLGAERAPHVTRKRGATWKAGGCWLLRRGQCAAAYFEKLWERVGGVKAWDVKAVQWGPRHTCPFSKLTRASWGRRHR